MPTWGLDLPLGKGAESLGFGGRGGRAGACFNRPGGEEASLFMGGRDTGPQGVERPEVEGREAELEGRESSLLTGILLGGFGPPGAACSLAIVTLLPSRHLKHCTRNPSLHFTPPLHWAASWPLLAPALAPGAPAACRAPRPPGETGHWASRGQWAPGHFPWSANWSLVEPGC